jgi:hypothetical protein
MGGVARQRCATHIDMTATVKPLQPGSWLQLGDCQDNSRGDDYVREVNVLLDFLNGRACVAHGPNRRRPVDTAQMRLVGGKPYIT